MKSFLLRVGSLLGRCWPRSLTNRVFALYGVTLLVFFGAGLGVFLAHQYRTQVEETQRASVMLIEVVAQAVQDSVVIGDYDTVRKILDKAVQESVFESASFIERGGGRIQANSRAPTRGRAPQPLVDWVERQLYDVNRAVSVGGKDYGVLRLHFDARSVAGDLWDLSVLALALGLAALAAGLTLVRILVSRWLGGLGRLREFERALASGSAQTSAPVEVGAPVEIRQVVELFNRTASLMREREASRRALDNQKFALDQHAIVSITDPDGAITYANDRFCQISGYAREELIGRNHRIIGSRQHPPDFFEHLWRTIAQGQVWRGEICNRARDGRLYWVDATIVPLLGEDGRPEQYIAIRTDISDRKAIEASLRAAKEVAERSDQAKSEFVANMSHEIRTPLNAVLGMLTLLRNTPLSQRQLDYASKADSSARSLLGLLNDILDFSKAEAGMMRLDPKPFRLDRLLRDLSVILSASIGDKDVEVLFDIDPALPRGLLGDDMRLQQVLINLGGNAVKFTEHGEVRLSVTVLENTGQEALMEFAMSDTGIGIAPEHQAQIFRGFSQAEASTTRRFGGTGLGLAISQRLLSLMGSGIELESTLGQGSTFRFRLRLPVVDCPAPDPRALLDPALTRLRVLVVDDNRAAREVLATMIGTLGWQVDLAEDGEQAIALAEASAAEGKPYDAIFVDWMMPGIDGWETSQRLRRSATLPEACLVMMVTAHARELLAGRDPAQQALIGGFLVKPVTASMLFDAVADARGRQIVGAPPAEAGGRRGRPRRLDGLRVLLVEDNPNNQQVARELLRLEGALVEVAGNGRLGVAAVAEANPPFDAVLMDLQMPEMDGLSATAEIRGRLGLRDLPIIAMTANASEADRQACLAAGMNDHVGKPFELAALVGTLLRHARPGAPSAAGAPAGPDLLAEGRLPAALVAAAAGHGIDLPAALARIEGETAIYLRMLQGFAADLPDMTRRLQTGAATTDPSVTVREMHTLRGLAAMLGATRLAELAGRIEAMVRTGTAAPASDAIAELVAAAEQARAGLTLIESSLGEPLPVPGTQDTRGIRQALNELIDLLGHADMRAMDVFESLRPSLGDPIPADTLRTLDEALAVLDFDLALTACRNLLGSLSS
ncbi:MAG: response regulator [Betaproteobacteria bacterium]|nr:response regulator [Betaproteobacteria bacterium]